MKVQPESPVSGSQKQELQSNLNDLPCGHFSVGAGCEIKNIYVINIPYKKKNEGHLGLIYSIQ
jgi:hypothetical protein